MTLPRVKCRAAAAALRGQTHVLFLLPAGDDLPAALPERAQWHAVLARRDTRPKELAKAPLALDLPQGGRAACVMVDAAQPRFERLTALRKGLMALLDETPRQVAIVDLGAGRAAALDAVYVAAVNGTPLPARKKKPARALADVVLHADGVAAGDLAQVLALARANLLARELTALPPNDLTPASYRKRIRALAKAQGWDIEEYDYKRLKKMGAGAFCAVAQGSDSEGQGGHAAIVHLSYRPKGAKHRVALVGKGICFDTGGHNLKPARHMQGMHEDMNGSAVALALLQALTETRQPLAVDAWLAVAHNHLSPGAYKQNDIVTTLDGTSIEIVHTDAEGRMVLADTLVLAARQAPQLIVDFATLTGSMHAALGSRYSGLFATSDALAAQAVGAGRESAERVCVFPLDEDYEQGEAGLESKVADVKQCTMAGEADHILAARFLKRFTADLPWVHVDLSASTCGGGLGAVATDLTGFGVAWGMTFLERWLSAAPTSAGKP